MKFWIIFGYFNEAQIMSQWTDTLKELVTQSRVNMEL